MGEAEGTAMQGNQKVSEQLNEALWSELTAALQSMLQSEMCQKWGYRRLGDLTKVR
jgi:bacterioferritin (cytochrome b1)